MQGHYDYPEARQVLVCGDIHGRFDELVYRMGERIRLTGTLVIVAGDCGFGFHRRGFYDQVYNRVLPKLEKANCWVVFVRGNHDNPAYFDCKEIDHERWRAVGDYSVVSVCGMNILCVGGATSVDRSNKESYGNLTYAPHKDYSRWFDKQMAAAMKAAVEHRLGLTPADYWTSERPYFDGDAMQAIKDAGVRVDTVVSHISPSFCEDVMPPSWLDYLIENDPALPDDMKRDRETMDRLLERLKTDGHPVSHWLYGHYHHYWTAKIEGVLYTMLSPMELQLLAYTKESEF